MGQMLADMGDQFLLRRGLAVAQNDEGADRLDPFRVGQGDHRHLRHRGMGVDRLLHLAAGAQDARQVDISYEITFAGISGFRIDVTARFNGTTYDVQTKTFKEGMLKAVTMNYVGLNRAWGGF